MLVTEYQGIKLWSDYDAIMCWSSLQNKGEFRENRRSVTYNLLKGVNEFLPYCPYLLAEVCVALCRGSARNALE